MASDEEPKKKGCTNPCGACCSWCCLIFSLWGAIMLVVIGVLLLDDYRGIVGDVPTVEDNVQAAYNSFYAAALYIFFIIISALRLIHLRLTRKPEVSMDDYEDVGAVSSHHHQ
mmetsp:Transcript_19569/g.75134  ORF Transcript_19569/g.75134 Transcript_19569/m.75134 type:complete len:113 (-) Transcript_19569:290-628(-)|eukprot:CAMPEP_0114630086 /NCGR_PEP_ID=MMETSP0168-20121206/13700_1 /TAXON_ID=95228 ORGANISM="Vannella sp., Strain DIVA3 517/6/12" /NCGR_SAMPLE_ID=MMETSP0168 /ASSEMBLY_ACC=CAM_ASM_000044 /LENGTH=112 /DNA_ID=CAMNT_0001841579 /DNA_START=213 /DNA_END=551 /DNA_ORIENTATION=-